MTKSREAAEQAIARAAAAQARDPNPHGLAPAQIQALHERYALSMPQLVSARPSNRISKFFDGIMPPGATFTAADDMARTAASRRGMLPGGAMLTGTGGNGIMTSPQLPYQPEFATPARQSFPVHRCLVEGTLVQYASGAVVPIEQVQVGDELLGPDGRSRIVLDRWQESPPTELVEIEWAREQVVRCSKEHRWPTARGLVQAVDIEAGDVIYVGTNGQMQGSTVLRMIVVPNSERTATYDITVSDDHLYCLAGGLVTHNSLANIYWRLFYKLDPVFQTGVNLISEMIFSKFRITGEGIDGEIHDMLEEQVETTQLHAHLAYFPREFLVVGEVIPHLFFDETRGIWTHLTLHDPDRIEVIWSPFLDMDPILQFRPDDELRKIVLSADPILSPIRDSMPEEVFTAIASGENITLSPINASLLARRMHPYNIRGDSVAAAMWETWMYEDAIRAASIAVARRGASPLKVAKLGDPATGYIPSPEQEARLMELLAASETDPNCFTPETPVTLADGSHKPIGDVEVGDLVRDRNGKVSEVTAAWSEVSDELVRIHVVGSGKIDCTPRHRWPVWRTPDVCQCGCETPITRGNFAPNHGMTGLGAPHRYWRPDAAPHKINGVKVRLLEGYDPHCEVTADQLRCGDYLKLPRRFRESRPHDVTADKARLLGYYAAEGSIREIYRRADGSVRLGFDLSFGLPEKDDVVEDAVAVIERVVGFPAYVNPIPERNGIQVASLRNESTPVAEWLRQHAGSMAQAKALSAEVMSWPLDLKYEFLRGYLGGDGCIVQSKDRQGYVEVGSASETLIDQVRLIVTQLGSLASKSWRRQSEKSFGPGNLFYRLHIYGELADRLSKDVWEREPLPRQKSRSTFWWADDDYVYAPVRKVERVTKPGAAFRVVNISVAGDHSYCVHGGVGTFNSWLVYNYAINFDLVGAQERSWKIEQSAEYVERMKLIALGISKSFLWGEISHASAASGLAVFLKRMRAMRDYFESSWLIPKFFKPISVMNKWIKPTEAELKHNVRVRRSFREVVEDRRYITPRIEWENSLDPSVDSAMIQAMQQLEGIGVKFSRTTKMALVNRDFQTELRQRVEESRYEQETLAANPDLALDGGGGAEGGGGGGGGMLPGMPPEALGLPPMEEGAPPEMGGEMPPEPPPASKQSDEGGETAALWDADGRYGSWTKEDATALRQLFRGEVPDDAPWQRMVESWKAKATTDPAARASLLALRLEDAAELWSGVQDWLLVEGYPPEALRQLAEIAASKGLIKVTAAAPDNIPEQFQSDTWLVGMPLKG